MSSNMSAPQKLSRRRFNAIRRVPGRIISSIRSKKTSIPVMPPPDLSSLFDYTDSKKNSGADDVSWDIDVGDEDQFFSHFQRVINGPQQKPVQSFNGLLLLRTKTLESFITNLDTRALHVFRMSSPRAAELAAFRGIQTHMLYIDPDMKPGEIYSTERKNKIITTASVEAVLATKRVKVRHLLKIGNLIREEIILIGKHIDSRFPSIVFEGCVNYRVFDAFLMRDKTVTMEIKNGVRLPKTDKCCFWKYFPGQKVDEIRKCFNSNHIFIKATYRPDTDSHILRVVPARDGVRR